MKQVDTEFDDDCKMMFQHLIQNTNTKQGFNIKNEILSK